MKHLKILILTIASSLGAMAADITVNPGQLQSLLPEGGKGQKELKISGKIDARDLAALENLSSDVKTLDLSNVKIEGLTMPDRTYFGRTLFNEGEIPAYTFFKTEITSLILPAETSMICEGAFAGSAIEEIVIPEGVTSIGDYAFYGCPNLKKVTVPSSLESIGKSVFGNCVSLESADLSKTKVTEIPDKAFAGATVLASVSLPQKLSKIEREAFSHTSITELNLSSVEEFGSYALSGMPFLKTLTINPEARIGDGLLMDDISLASLSGMPEFIPDYFAANCSALPTEHINRTSSLGKYSFANTLAPEELVLAGSIEKIERGALSGLTNLKRIDVTALEDRVPLVDEFSFEGIEQPEIVLWVDDEAFDLWEGDPVWRLFKVMSQNQTGIENVGAETASDISISYRGGILTIESAALVSDVRIYTPDGRMAYVASPDREKVEIETAFLPSGIVIVAASDREGNAKTISLLLK